MCVLRDPSISIALISICWAARCTAASPCSRVAPRFGSIWEFCLRPCYAISCLLYISVSFCLNTSFSSSSWRLCFSRKRATPFCQVSPVRRFFPALVKFHFANIACRAGRWCGYRQRWPAYLIRRSSIIVVRFFESHAFCNISSFFSLSNHRTPRIALRCFLHHLMRLITVATRLWFIRKYIGFP